MRPRSAFVDGGARIYGRGWSDAQPESVGLRGAVILGASGFAKPSNRAVGSSRFAVPIAAAAAECFNWDLVPAGPSRRELIARSGEERQERY